MLQRTTPEHRLHARRKLRVLLKLRGTDAKGKPVEISSITENLSENGFFCNCIVPLIRRADVEVFLSGSKERYAGSQGHATGVAEPLGCDMVFSSKGDQFSES